MKEQLTQSRLKELLHYDPETGIFTWRVGRPGCAAGKATGSKHRTLGYVQIGVDRKILYAHRLAFLYMTGVWPVEQVDHVNGDRADNRWINLRQVSHSENMQNIGGPRADNTSGLLGVCWNKRDSNWNAQIKAHGRRVNLGGYPTPEAAHAAYLKAKDELHPTHRRLRSEA